MGGRREPGAGRERRPLGRLEHGLGGRQPGVHEQDEELDRVGQCSGDRAAVGDSASVAPIAPGSTTTAPATAHAATSPTVTATATIDANATTIQCSATSTIRGRRVRMPSAGGCRHTPRPTLRREAPGEERDRGGDGRAGDGNHADLPMIRRIHHHPDAFSTAPAPRQIEPDDPSTAARVAGLVARSSARAATGSEGEHQRRETGLGAVHIAVGQVGSAGAQRRGGAVERLRGRSAEVGAGMQHAKCELDARVARRDAPGGAGDGVSSVEGQTDRRDDPPPMRGTVLPTATRWRGTHPSECGGRGRRTMPRRRRRRGGHAAGSGQPGRANAAPERR